MTQIAAAATSCVDNTHSGPIAEGALLSIEMTETGNISPSVARWTAKLTP